MGNGAIQKLGKDIVELNTLGKSDNIKLPNTGFKSKGRSLLKM